MGATGFGGGNEKKTVGEEHGDHGVRWEKFLPQVYSKVLLVESDDSTRQIIAALLRKCGYRVSAVADGLKAWETLKEHPQNVDLVLTEVELPSMSGYSLLSMVMEHKTFKNIPVIVMSSKDSVDMAFKCLLKGASDFLFKPIRKNELQNLWQHVWRKRLSDEDKVPGLYQKQEAADNTTNASRDPQDKSITPLENCQPDCVSSSAGSDLREPVSDASCTSEFAGLDLLRTMDNHPPCSADQPEALIDAKNEDVKFLELSLESHALKVLNHSSFSAFSTYNRRHSSPARGQCTVSNASLGSSVTSQGGGVCDPVLISHREEALKKYRLKRKDRCFEKAKNLSRSTHAEKQPRVKELTNHG